MNGATSLVNTERYIALLELEKVVNKYLEDNWCNMPEGHPLLPLLNSVLKAESAKGNYDPTETELVLIEETPEKIVWKAIDKVK